MDEWIDGWMDGREGSKTACHFYYCCIGRVVTEISSGIPSAEDSNIIFAVSVFLLCLCFPGGPFHPSHSFQQFRIFVPCHVDCKNYFSSPNHNSTRETLFWLTNFKIPIILIQLLAKLYEEGLFYWKGRCFFILFYFFIGPNNSTMYMGLSSVSFFHTLLL